MRRVEKGNAASSSLMICHKAAEKEAIYWNVKM